MVETLSNVEEVEVTKDQWTDDTGYDFYRWTVRTEPTGLLVVFKGIPCDCSASQANLGHDPYDFKPV